MVRWAVAIGIALSIFASPPVSFADRTFKCGTRLVSIGDTVSDVLDACGPPDHVERRSGPADAWVSQRFDYRSERYKAPKLTKGPLQEEIWTYKPGPGQFLRYLYFRNAELIRIQTGEKGAYHLDSGRQID